MSGVRIRQLDTIRKPTGQLTAHIRAVVVSGGQTLPANVTPIIAVFSHGLAVTFILPSKFVGRASSIARQLYSRSTKMAGRSLCETLIVA